jgi:hypothetical protein
MKFNEAKEVLKQGYLDNGIEFLSESETEIRMALENEIYLISKTDIEEYAAFEDRKSSFQNSPCECSMCNSDYREHVVYPVERRAAIIANLVLEKNVIVFGDASSGKTFAVISPASEDFINYFRFNKDFLGSYLRHYPVRTTKRRGDGEPLDVRELLRRPPTIKVFKISETNVERAVTKSSKVIEDCLFQLSYLKNIPFWLAEAWPHHEHATCRARFIFREPYEGWNLPLKTSFNSDLIRFYQFATSTDVPELKFLSFYQILEYFFLQTSNENLYEILSNRIKDPKFTHTSTHLDRIVQDVIKHRAETDETEMLKSVLHKFIEETELIEFIIAYEKHLGRNVYTKKHNVFGVSVQIELEKGHTIGNVARHIKEIRNALVHSSDKYEGNVRHVPFTKTTEQIRDDIPLIKFLAERVIVASSNPY